MSVYKRGKKGTHWHYYFRVRGVRYRGVISEARTKKQAEQAESKIKQEIFEGRFGLVNSGTMKLAKFIDEIYRYLLPEEEPLLLNVMEGKRAHLRPLVIVALGLGLRKREQLNLRRGQVDFSRNVVIATRTKGRKNREIPLDVLNPEVREILKKACHGKDAEDYVFTNPDTDKPFYDIKRSFHACRTAGIKTFGGTIYEPPSARVWRSLATKH